MEEYSEHDVSFEQMTLEVVDIIKNPENGYDKEFYTDDMRTELAVSVVEIMERIEEDSVVEAVNEYFEENYRYKPKGDVRDISLDPLCASAYRALVGYLSFEEHKLFAFSTWPHKEGWEEAKELVTHSLINHIQRKEEVSINIEEVLNDEIV